jgi:hypothetical protein
VQGQSQPRSRRPAEASDSAEHSPAEQCDPAGRSSKARLCGDKGGRLRRDAGRIQLLSGKWAAGAWRREVSSGGTSVGTTWVLQWDDGKWGWR